MSIDDCSQPSQGPSESKIRRRHGRSGSIFSQSYLLPTESKKEFDRLRRAFIEDIQPRGAVEEMYTNDVWILTWDILRFRRCRTGLIGSKLRDAMETTIPELLRGAGERAHEYSEHAKELAEKWFSDEEARQEVRQLLEYYQLDESVFEAEAVKKCLKELEILDRLSGSAESRRNKAILMIGEYRFSLSDRLRQSSDRVIEGKAVSLVPNTKADNPAEA